MRWVGRRLRRGPPGKSSGNASIARLTRSTSDPKSRVGSPWYCTRPALSTLMCAPQRLAVHLDLVPGPDQDGMAAMLGGADRHRSPVLRMLRRGRRLSATCAAIAATIRSGVWPPARSPDHRPSACTSNRTRGALPRSMRCGSPRHPRIPRADSHDRHHEVGVHATLDGGLGWTAPRCCRQPWREHSDSIATRPGRAGNHGCSTMRPWLRSRHPSAPEHEWTVGGVRPVGHGQPP